MHPTTRQTIDQILNARDAARAQAQATHAAAQRQRHSRAVRSLTRAGVIARA
jgi:hypothetical protein